MASKAKKTPARKPAQAKTGAAAALAERSKDAHEKAAGGARKPAAFGKADPRKAKPAAANDTAKPAARKSGGKSSPSNPAAPGEPKQSLAARVAGKVRNAAASLLGR